MTAPVSPPARPPALGRCRRTLWLALVVVAAAAVITVRALYSGEAQLAASTDALKAGDAHQATVRARRAASWYVPGAPHVGVAYQRLIALAEAAERNQRDDIALLAWRAVRSASQQTRWLITPHARDAARAEREIARLSSVAPGAAVADPDRVRQQLKLLATHPGPSRLWAVVLLLSFVLALAGLWWWIRKVAASAGQLLWRQARGPTTMTLAALLLWLLAVWRA